MAGELDTEALRRLLDGKDADVQLVEVLPATDFDEEHLPGAMNVPLAELGDGVGALDPTKPTVVYGFDLQDDRAHRAATRLAANGFADVRVYAAGKVAWLAEGLPGEGRRRPEQRIAAIARTDIPTIEGGATISDAARTLGPDDEVAIVLDADEVVLGVLRRETLGLAPSTPVADALQPGPSTFRPSMTIAELVEYFRKSDERRAIVSTAGGRFLGLIRREDVADDA
jgi:rhodanese-related sulfurtransferase/CBS domain-containing protein